VTVSLKAGAMVRARVGSWLMGEVAVSVVGVMRGKIVLFA
jgi:hypothetical protein